MSKKTVLSKIWSFKLSPSRSNRGFTLIELLIAVSIIAILVSIGAASFVKARSQARDSQRLSDLGDIQSALEQYYAANLSYPSSGGVWLSSAIDDTTWIPGANIYISGGLPWDVKHSDGYTYQYASANEGTTYLLVAALENEKSDLPKSPQGTFDLIYGIGVDIFDSNNNCDERYDPDPPDCVIFHGPVTD
jgi:prepilin-type N-terminal cleavage/methylation domain-containing protein